MDIASTLIRSVARAFYHADPAYIIIIDALIMHSTLRDDDLALLLGTQTKHLRKLCGRLREDGLISVHARAELREGSQRPFNRDYYFINFHKAIDVIKYRLKVMMRSVEAKYSQTAEEKKEYHCPQCKAEWTQMEVLDSMDDNFQFVCKTCRHLLSMSADTNGSSNAGYEVQSKLNAQLAPFEDLMKQIDSMSIPENDFDTALANARPILRNESINPSARTQIVGNGKLPPATVRGLKTDPEKVEITLLDDSQKSRDLEQAAEAERRAKTAAQNALPAWYTVSTVTGEQTGIGGSAAQNATAASAATKLEEDEKKIAGGGDSSALDSYFNALKEEQEMQAKRDREEEDEFEDDDDDDDGFEDVAIAEDVPTQKKVKIMEPEKEVAAAVSAAPSVANGPAADSDEDDFEDAL